MLAKPTGGVGTTTPGGQAERIAEGSPAGVGRRWRRRRRRRRGRGRRRRGRGRRPQIMSSVRREPCLSPPGSGSPLPILQNHGWGATSPIQTIWKSFTNGSQTSEGPILHFKPFGGSCRCIHNILMGQCHQTFDPFFIWSKNSSWVSQKFSFSPRYSQKICVCILVFDYVDTVSAKRLTTLTLVKLFYLYKNK